MTFDKVVSLSSERDTLTMHPLHAATFHIPDMAAGLCFYRDVLGYRPQSESTVSDALAGSWHAEKLAGAISVLMEPEAGSAGGHIRLIESPDAISCTPFQHYGWCGVEFAVQDNLTLAQHLKEAGCDILMEPMPPYRPMAAAGVFGEGLLFNEPQEKNPFHYTVIDTKSPVDQIAIVVLACRDRTLSEDFYGQLLGAKPGHRAEMPLPFANKAMGLSEETIYQTGAMRVGRTPFIEIDQ